MQIKFLDATPRPCDTIVWAARFSHRSHDRSSPESDRELFLKLAKWGHWSAFEFNRWTVLVRCKDLQDWRILTSFLGNAAGWELSPFGSESVVLSGNARTLLDSDHKVSKDIRQILAKERRSDWGWISSPQESWQLHIPHVAAQQTWDLYSPDGTNVLPIEERAKHWAFLIAVHRVSRVLTHQVVRYRRCSFMQESLRYVDVSDGVGFVTPPSIRQSTRPELYEGACHVASGIYATLRQHDVPTEDARYVLPMGTHSAIVVLASLRQWAHICRQRLSPKAQWEIRNFVNSVYGELAARVPWWKDYLGNIAKEVDTAGG